MILTHPVKECPECGSQQIRYRPQEAEIFCNECGYIISKELPYIETYGGVADIYYSVREKELKYVFPNALRTVKERVIKRVVRDLWSLYYLGLKKYHRKEIIKRYIKLYEEGWTERRNRKEVLAALYFLILRREHKPILIEDFRFIEDKSKILDYAKEISRKTDLKLVPGDPKMFIHRFGAELKIPDYLITSALEIYKEGGQLSLFRNRSYKTISLACLLVACKTQNLTFSRDDLKSTTKVSLTAQSKLRNEIKEKIGLNKIRNIVNFFSS